MESQTARTLSQTQSPTDPSERTLSQRAGPFICYLDPGKLVDEFLYGKLSGPYIKAKLAEIGDWSMHQDSLWEAAFEGVEQAAETWRPDGGASPRTWAKWGMRNTVRAKVRELYDGTGYHHVVGMLEYHVNGRTFRDRGSIVRMCISQIKCFLARELRQFGL